MDGITPGGVIFLAMTDSVQHWWPPPPHLRLWKVKMGWVDSENA